MLMVDSEGRIVKVNLATCTFFGREPPQPRRHAGRRRCCTAPGSTGAGAAGGPCSAPATRSAAEVRHAPSGAGSSRPPSRSRRAGRRRAAPSCTLRDITDVKVMEQAVARGARRLGGDLRQHPGGHHHPRRELPRAARERRGAAAARLRATPRSRGCKCHELFHGLDAADRRLPRLRDPPLRRGRPPSTCTSRSSAATSRSRRCRAPAAASPTSCTTSPSASRRWTSSAAPPSGSRASSSARPSASSS